MLADVVTWWTFFKVSINERLVYRADFMLGTLMRFLPTLTQIFLWWAIYDVISTPGSAESAGGPDKAIAGYRYTHIVIAMVHDVVAVDRGIDGRKTIERLGRRSYKKRHEA